MKRRIAQLGLVLALAGPLGNALGQAPAGGTRFEQRWPFAADGSVRIVNPAGRIRVIGWDTDSLAVSGRGPGSLAAAGTAHEIGRGPGRGKGEISGGAGSFKKKKSTSCDGRQNEKDGRHGVRNRKGDAEMVDPGKSGRAYGDAAITRAVDNFTISKTRKSDLL